MCIFNGYFYGITSIFTSFQAINKKLIKNVLTTQYHCVVSHSPLQQLKKR
jgi:hypothetical protein